MAIRVDNIAVTEKNIMLLSEGRQYVVDIEKESDALDERNSDRNRNSWNFYSEDGRLYHNIFPTSGFDMRTQVLTGSTRHSPNNGRSHEAIFMPNDVGYVGMCQFYGNAYSITDFTNNSISSDVMMPSGCSTYSSDDGFIRYDALSAYDNPTKTYITPKYLYEPDSGVQFISEYPLNGLYSDFGDNENDTNPTVFSDSVISKYYLDSNYSVSSYDINDRDAQKIYSNFRQLRTYYGIGSTGDSIYAVFRNDRNGSSETVMEYFDNPNGEESPFSLIYAISSIGYMSNTVTYCGTDKIMYSADPYSDVFEYIELSAVASSDGVFEPYDHSFILYVKCKPMEHEKTHITFTYLPKVGLDKSMRTLELIMFKLPYDEMSVVELPHSISIGAGAYGIINVRPPRMFQGSESNVTVSPFSSACSGMPFPSWEEAYDKILGYGHEFEHIELKHNGKDMLVAVCTLADSGNKVAFVSTAYSDGENDYDIGQFFMPAGRPDYEVETLSDTTYTTSDVMTSVPVSSTVDGKTTWSYVLTSLSMVVSSETVTSDPFDFTTNHISGGAMFDYSSTEVEGELSVGSYALLQFEKYGLGKCYVGDVYAYDKMAKFTSTGPSNRITDSDNADGWTCVDAVFSVNVHGDESIDSLFKDIDYISGDYKTDRVRGRSALRAIYKDKDGNYANSFSMFPFDLRYSSILEPRFSSESFIHTEIFPTNVYECAMDKPLKDSFGIAVKTYDTESINHDAAISVVSWNNIPASKGVTMTPPFSPSGMYLQYNGICTDVVVEGSVNSSVNEADGKTYPYYTSTEYEYPHPCFGHLATAGTNLPIFSGPLSESMEWDDMLFVNGYFVVKNYSVDVLEGTTEAEIMTSTDGSVIWNSGKHSSYDTGAYPSGGYVVTNFFADKGLGNEIPSLYGSELVDSDIYHPSSFKNTESFYDFRYLWHVKPVKPIEFYPESVKGKEWKPFYASKYVEFIKYHNGYYYIALRNTKSTGTDTVGYEIIETDTLFEERPLTPLGTGEWISGIKFFDKNVAIEYHHRYTKSVFDEVSGTFIDEDVDEVYMKWFESGKSDYKSEPTKYQETDASAITTSELTTTKDVSNRVVAKYDNVEVMKSLNRFTPVVNHKSNLFSIRVDDLGFEDSPYLSDYQKTVLRTYFKNRITEMVNAVKPAHTQLFDVYLS